MVTSVAPARQVTDHNGLSETTAEFFHALNQPLTALYCLFELALHAPRSEDEYRTCLEQGLAKVADTAALASGMREWLEAAEPSAAPSRICLQELVKECVEHFLPVANDAGTAIALHCKADSMVLFDRDRLRRALFYLFDLMLPLARGEALSIIVRETTTGMILNLACRIRNAEARRRGEEIFFATQPLSMNDANWKQRTKWMIAQQLLRTGQGEVVIVGRSEKERENLRVEMRLPIKENKSE